MKKEMHELKEINRKLDDLRTMRKSTAKDYTPGSLGCHEALHMASVLAETVDERLCQRPAIVAKPEWENMAQKACEALHDLYQAIGQEHG